MEQSPAIRKEIQVVRRSLRILEHSLGRLSPLLSVVASSAVRTSNGNGRSRPRLSAKARASLVLQGRYMGYMRQLKPRQKVQVRKVREAKGVKAAIARARGLVKK